MQSNGHPRKISTNTNQTLRSCLLNQKHTSQQVYLIVHQELRSLKVTGGNSDVVFLRCVVKFSQAPVNKAQLQKKT